MATPVYNPSIPYVGPLPTGRLTPGTILRISGNSQQNASCFAINLQCGPNLNPRDDLALHLSPVFSQPARIVRNSLQYSQWGPEESSGGFPLSPGTPFEIMILVERDHFKIAVNGQHFCEFYHRIPLERISHIAIDGQVSVNMIGFEGSVGAPNAPPMPSAPHHGDQGLPPYPVGPTMGMPAPGYGPPPISGAGYPPGPPTSSAPGYPPASGGPSYPQAYPSASTGYPAQAGYPGQGQYPSSGYPAQGASGYSGQGSQGYPGQGAPAYPGQGAPGYPGQGATGYPSTSSSGPSKGLLAGLTAGAGALGAGMLASKVAKKTHMPFLNPMGGGHGGMMGGMFGGKHHKSSPIPIGGLAAGAGAAALGAAMLSRKPKKLKKLYKHKGHKFGKWKHKGWSSSSSSEEE